MFSPSHLKTLLPLQVKSSSSSSALSSMKIKSLIHTLIVSHMCRIIRALSKLKAVIIGILKDNNNNQFSYPSQKKSLRSKSKRIIYGSFRLHYNWCSSRSSHIRPVPSRVYEGLGLPSVDATGTLSNCEPDCLDSQLAGYLQWLEEKRDDEDDKDDDKSGAKEIINEIDLLAEMFIANCHEKFRLEKQESDRKFHEMLARSL